MAVPDAPFEEAVMLGKRYRKFNDNGNTEAFHKTYNEFLDLKDGFSSFNDKVTLASAFLSGYNGKVAPEQAKKCKCNRCQEPYNAGN